MVVEDLMICPLTQTVYINPPDVTKEKLYQGYVANIPENLFDRKVRCMYSAYNEKKQIPVLVVDIWG